MSQPSTPALNPTYMKVFIQRDYSDGTSVKFQTRFPPELEGRVNINKWLFLYSSMMIWTQSQIRLQHTENIFFWLQTRHQSDFNWNKTYIVVYWTKYLKSWFRWKFPLVHFKAFWCLCFCQNNNYSEFKKNWK